MDSSENEDQSVARTDHLVTGFDDDLVKEMLLLARETIRHYLLNHKTLDYQNNNIVLMKQTGVFVTLWGGKPAEMQTATSCNSELRGCIGRLNVDAPLYDAVQEVAIGAATRDPRFDPVTLAELDTIRIEIAILSPMQIVKYLQQVEVGKHGLMIEGLGKRGLLLPKVATRMGWDREAFLDGVCQKAGLARNSWPGDSVLYAFRTVVFDEADIPAT